MKWLYYCGVLALLPSCLAFVLPTFSGRLNSGICRTASLRATLDQWNADLQACADKSDAEGAKAKLEAMKAEGVEPDYLSYAGVVTACGRAGDGPGFKSYMSEMKENKVIAKNVEDGLKEKSSK